MPDGSTQNGHDLPAPLLELDRRIAAAVEGRLATLRGQIEERLRSSGNELLKAAEDLRFELPSQYLVAADIATFAAARSAAGAGSEAVLASVARIDRARTQPDLLSVLLEEARRFASRSAFFLTRPDGIHGWSSRGFGSFDRPIDEVVFPYESDDIWSTLAKGQGPVALGASSCARLAERLGTNIGSQGALVPFVLRGHLAGALYADHLADSDGSFDAAALQLLVHSAALSLETLALREDAGSPALRGASADRDTEAKAMGLWSATATAATAAAGVASTAAVTDETATPVEASARDLDGGTTDDAATDAQDDAPDALPTEQPTSIVDAEAVDSDVPVDSPEPAPEPRSEEVASDNFTFDVSEPETLELEPIDSSMFETDESPVGKPPLADDLDLDSIDLGSADLGSADLGSADNVDLGSEPQGLENSATTNEVVAEEAAPTLDVWEDEDPTVETPFRAARAAVEASANSNLEDTRATNTPDFELDYGSSEAVTEAVRPMPSLADLDPNEDATIVASRGEMITPSVEKEVVEPEPVASVGLDDSSMSLPSTPDTRTKPRGGSQVVPPMDVDGPGFAFVGGSQPAQSAAVPDGEEALHEEAKRLARLLVSEIKLYNEEVIEEGRRDGSIYARLKEDIDRSRQMYDERIDPRLREHTDYFVDELVQRLAGGDASVMGL